VVHAGGYGCRTKRSNIACVSIFRPDIVHSSNACGLSRVVREGCVHFVFEFILNINVRGVVAIFLVNTCTSFPCKPV
jgi:hypothetical protein